MHLNMANLRNAMIGQIDKNNAIANNLANINTMGYKKDYVFFDAFNEEMSIREGQNQSVDFAQGQLKETSNRLDMALSSKGFFTVETDTGVAYTREGHFKLDNDGILRTSAGHAVLGESGPVVLLGKNIRPESVTITSRGEVFCDEEYINQLEITGFENTDQLQKVGSNLFRAKEEGYLMSVDEVQVHQGFLEQSNVNPADEMIQLIEVQRQFESLQKMVRSLDDVFRSAATQVGKY